MIEVLFTESAAGSMRYAKSVRSTIGGAASIVWFSGDGSKPSAEEIARAEDEHRKKRESAVPMEGSARDVAWFPLNLSVGDISEPFSDGRAEFLQSMVLIPGPEFAEIGAALVCAARESLTKVLMASEAGQPIRIWTSKNPDELCGLCHLLTLLPKGADVRVVELPEYEVEGDTLTAYSGWGEVDSMDLGRMQALERSLNEAERRYFAGVWRELQRENGPLRAMVNGQLCTVGADFYDTFLLRELEKQPEEFHEARLIGQVLGRHPLGVGDSFLALRLEEFISRGMLAPVTEPAEGEVLYRRWLRKC